ncbi:hypothetical protein [Blastococcus sp. PRF04-17]|uniref:hypothetical protein n=1 Tax=Blastococcus sp. PRF04-17 TaxID=2933797 RepID=UPI001FF47FCB|nr:hypothetical protein [Blastococcus sp. PRF04-17]UOY03668.1 hypothetical protein MVA48_10190 [Blastococcus sp. PRF04-17]
MTTTAISEAPARARGGSAVLPALAGIGGLLAFAGTVVVFDDPLAGATTAAEAAEAMAGAPVGLAAVLLAGYALLAIAVTGRLAAHLAAHLSGSGDPASVRLMPVLGAGHVLLLTAAFAAPAAAVTVGDLVLEGGVTPGGAETALVLMNLAHPMSAWVGIAFLVAVAVAGRRSRGLAAFSIVFAVGLALPPVGWAFTYLMPLWFAGVGIWLWRRA